MLPLPDTRQSERTVIPDGRVIRELRLKKKMSRDELAAESCVCRRTIDNAEKDRPVFRVNLRNIAQALGVKHHDLMRPGDGPLPAVPIKATTLSNVQHRLGQPLRVTLTLCVEGDHDSFVANRELDTFVERLRHILMAEEPIQPTDVEKGSILISLSLAPDDADRLIDAFEAGRLEEIGVTDLINQTFIDWLNSPEGRAYASGRKKTAHPLDGLQAFKPEFD